MTRRRKNREQRIADVVEAWDSLPRGAKADLMDYPDLYAAVAWLVAHETARSEMRWR